MARNLLSSSAFIRTFILAWFIWMLLHASLIYWLGYSVSLSVSDSLLFNIPLMAICLFPIYMMQYYLPKKEKLGYIIIAGILISLIVTFISGLLISLVLSGNAEYLSFVNKSYPVRLGVAFLLSACTLMVNILVYTLEDQKMAEKRRHEAEQLSKESELQNLRSQLQPHFLFNSLNSISALAGSRPEEARKMIQQLSDFFRGTIRKDDRSLVSLKEELSHLQLYLDIEKVRFGHRLETEIICDDAAASMKIPPLLLQPVIENAIKFGLYDTTGNVVIRIKAEKEDHHLIVTVQNPFDATTTQPQKGTGFGLQSVQRRLFLLFSRTDLLHTSARDAVYTTTIKIPQIQ